jgi:hypothetical protein
MRLIGFLVAACLALAVLQVAIQVVIVVAIIAFLVALITRPADVIGLIAFFVALHLALSYPLIGIPGFIAFVILGALVQP